LANIKIALLANNKIALNSIKDKSIIKINHICLAYSSRVFSKGSGLSYFGPLKLLSSFDNLYINFFYTHLDFYLKAFASNLSPPLNTVIEVLVLDHPNILHFFVLAHLVHLRFGNQHFCVANVTFNVLLMDLTNNYINNVVFLS